MSHAKHLVLFIVLAAIAVAALASVAQAASTGDWKRAMVKCNRKLDKPVRVHHRLNYRNSWGFAAKATAWRLSRRLSGTPTSTRLTAALKRKLRKYLPKRSWKLSASQVRKAQRGVPRASARWAPLVNKYWSRWLQKYKGRRLTAGELNRALWVIHYESSGRPRCVGPGPYYCRGLMQLLPGHGRGRYDLFNPRTNISLAGQLYCRRGWRPWAATAYRR